MKSLIVMENNKPMTTSFIVADYIGVEHRSVIKLVREHKKELEMFGTLKLSVRKSGGRPSEFAYLEEEQVTYLITLMNNSENVIKFKMLLIKQFYAMKKALLEAHSRQNNSEWIEMRTSGKQIRKSETETIKEFVDYATEQGSQHASTYYSNITKMENKALFLLEQKFDNIRELLTGQQLMVLGAADQVVEKALKEGMIAKLNYKDIYQMAKERVETFASVLPKTPVVMLNEIKQLK